MAYKKARKSGKKSPMDHSKHDPGNKGTAPPMTKSGQVCSREAAVAPAHRLARHKAGYEQGTF